MYFFLFLCTVASICLAFPSFFSYNSIETRDHVVSLSWALAAHLVGCYLLMHCHRALTLWNVWRRIKRDRARLLRACKRYARRQAFRDSRRRRVRGFCWLPLFPHVPKEVAFAVGGYLSLHRRFRGFRESQFETLVRLYSRSSLYGEITKYTHVVTTHLKPGSSHSFLHTTARCIGVDAQAVIDTAVGTNSSRFGEARAGQLFDTAFKNAIKVTTALTRSQRSKVERLIPHPLLFTDESATITDHAELRACREVSRTVFDRLYGIRNTRRPTLCVGAGKFESIYLGNASVDHYYHMSEGKDYERVTGWILEDLAKLISSRAKHHSRLRKSKGESHEDLAVRGATELLAKYKEHGKFPNRFYTELPKDRKYEVLAFHDSHYNFSSEDWYNIFRSTDAKVAYCYGLLPLELVYPDMPPNDLYTMKFDPLSGTASFYYGVGGYSNGYTHARDTWALPLDRPVLNFPDFSILFEVDARAGPMAVFKAVRVDGPSVQAITRSVNLPKAFQFVRCMDPFESCKADGSVQPKYFSVFADEFWETVNYALALDPKSLSFANLLAFVRRRGGGISLVNKELLSPWNLRQSRFAAFCMCVFLFVRRQQASVDAVSEHTVFQLESTFASRVAYWCRVLDPRRYIYSLLNDPKYLDALVLFPEDSHLQRDYLKVLRNPGKPTHRIVVGETDAVAHSCDICAAYVPKRGKQVIQCIPGSSRVKIGMSTEELNALRMDWNDTDGDPAGLKKIKEEAAKALPLTAFEHEVDFFYICGGPGCGKSHFIRAVATPLDGIALPFTKLVPDYQGLSREDGSKYNLNAKTFHRAVRDLRGCDKLFVDEFTAMPWETIQAITYLCGASQVFIVGDTKQTKVQPSEGKYIGDHVDIDKLPTHVLRRNFRNPKDAVCLLNTQHGYDMQAMSEIEQSIFIYGPADGEPDDLGEQAAFSHDTCTLLNLSGSDGKDRTVRTYQGSTVKGHAYTLRIDSADEKLLSSDELTIVSLSRHVDRLNIVHNGSDAAKAWLDKNNLPHSRTSIDAGVLPCTTPVHKQETDPLPIDDDELGRVFSDLAPSKVRPGRAGFNVSFSLLLSVFFFLRKWYFGAAFLNGFDILFFLLKFAYLNRLFLIHRLGWAEWWKVLPKSFAISWLVQQMVSTILVPLRVFFPWLSYFVQRTRPGVPQPAWPLRAGFFFCYRLTGFDPMIVWRSGFRFIIERSYDRILSLPQPLADLLLTLHPYFHPVQYFCDVIEPFLIQLVVAIFFRKRVFLQEDILFRIEAPALLSDDRFHDLVNGVAISEKFDSFRDWALTYIPASLRKWTLPLVMKDVALKLPSNVSAKDAYLFARDCLPAWADVRLGLEYPNLLAPAVIFDVFRTGTMSVADFLRPTNARGHPKKPASAKYCFGAVAGHRFTGNQPTQVLQVLAARYFNVKPSSKKALSDPAAARSLIDDIIHAAKTELLADRPLGWDEDTLDELAAEFFRTADAKHYAKQFVGDDNPDGRQIQFHLKNIFKPALSDQKPMDVFKAGQGISAWNKDPQIMFGLCAKWINFVIIKSLRPNVTYDNRMTEQQLRSKLREFWDKVPNVAKNGVTDFKMFDAQQDEFSQMLEKAFLALIGCSQEFIDHYYSFRKGQRLVAPGISGRCDTEKTSGEPLTLTGNSVISMLLANYLLRGDGPFLLAFKGDDGFKRQCNMRIDQSRIDRLSTVCRLNIKAYCEDTAEFCGYAIGARSFCPSIPRKLAKVLGHEFRDYAHYCEYRMAMLDWLKDFDSQDTADIIATNHDLFNMPITEVEAQMQVIRSLAHLNETQFYEQARMIAEPEVLQDGGTRGKL